MNYRCEQCFYWRYNPCRSIQYRWDRALEVVEEGQRLSKQFDDHYMYLAVKFLRALRGCQTEMQHLQLAREMPAIYAAYNIHKAGGELELELQARILALHGTEQLAEMFGMDIATIDMYRLLFFYFQDRPHAQDWILTQAVGIWERNLASLIKSLGYFGGPLVLDALLPCLLRTTHSIREPLFTGERAASTAHRARLFEQLWTMRINDAQTACKLMRAMPAIDMLIKQRRLVELEGILARILPGVPRSVPELHANTQADTKSTCKQQATQARKEDVA